MILRTPWQDARAVGLRIARPDYGAGRAQLSALLLGQPTPAATSPRPGLVRLGVTRACAEVHEDAARLGWPSEGSWCE